MRKGRQHKTNRGPAEYEGRDKRNPNSLTSLIREISFEQFGGNIQRTAEGLSDVRPERLYDVSALTPGQVDAIFNSRSHIKYYQLEAFANVVGVPTGILLLVSRLKSMESDAKGQEQQEELIFQIRSFLTKLESGEFEDFNGKSLLSFAERFKEELRNRNSQQAFSL